MLPGGPYLLSGVGGGQEGDRDKRGGVEGNKEGGREVIAPEKRTGKSKRKEGSLTIKKSGCQEGGERPKRPIRNGRVTTIRKKLSQNCIGGQGVSKENLAG